MRILHLNTFDVGGAAVAALRLHNGLELEGVESSFLSLHRYDTDNVTVNDYNLLLKANFKERISSSLKYRTQKILYKKISGFNYPFSPYNVHEHPLIKGADIIHLHWVSRFVNVFSFVSAMKEFEKPIVWTLHDLNPISGGYHYTEVGEENKVINEKYLRLKRDLIKSYDNIYMASPSIWIYDQILESGFVNKKNASLIKYGINVQVFKPVNKGEAKSRLNINPNKKVVLFLATDIEDERKGLAYFLKSIEFIREKENVQFVCVGGGEFPTPLSSNFKFLGSISDPKELVNVYSAADIFVIPSLEDNLPNTIIESLACGTPVVGFNTGGIPDLIIDHHTGFLARKGDEKDLAKKINMLLESHELRKNFSINARAFVEENCDHRIQSKKYIELYNSVLS